MVGQNEIKQTVLVCDTILNIPNVNLTELNPQKVYRGVKLDLITSKPIYHEYLSTDEDFYFRIIECFPIKEYDDGYVDFSVGEVKEIISLKREKSKLLNLFNKFYNNEALKEYIGNIRNCLTAQKQNTEVFNFKNEYLKYLATNNWPDIKEETKENIYKTFTDTNVRKRAFKKWFSLEAEDKLKEKGILS